MTFKPGQSGSPGGGNAKRLTTRSLRKMIKKNGMEALKVIKDLMDTAEDEPTRLAAAKYLADRAYGKPTQATEISGGAGASLIPGITVNVMKPDLLLSTKSPRIPTIEEALAEVKEAVNGQSHD